MKAKELGKMIHKGRIDKEMSRMQLAREVGCSAQTVFRWEKGQLTPSLKNLTSIEDVLQTGILTKEFMEKAGGE